MYFCTNIFCCVFFLLNTSYSSSISYSYEDVYCDVFTGCISHAIYYCDNNVCSSIRIVFRVTVSNLEHMNSPEVPVSTSPPPLPLREQQQQQ